MINDLTPAFNFRQATVDDAEAVASLIARVWTKHFGWSVPAADLEVHLQTKLSTESIGKSISSPDERFLIVTDDGEKVAGVAQLIFNSREACLTLPHPVELNRLYIEDEYHGSGIAGELVNKASEMARENGGGSLWLGVWENNARAKRFYEKMGFKTVGEHTFMVGENVRRDWVMEKPI